MLLQDISDVEGFLKSLKSENKLNVTSNINFLIISYLSKQKNIDPYSFMDKFASILSEENQSKFANEIKLILPQVLKKKEENNINQKINLIDDKLKVDIAKAIKNDIIKETTPDSDVSISLIEKMRNQASSLLNKINEKEVVEEKPQDHDIVQKTKLEEYQALKFEFPSVVEGLKYIKPELTEKTKEELLRFGFEPKVYSALRIFYHEDSLFNLYRAHFPNISMIDFVRNRILSLEKNQYLTFIKSDDFPNDKNFRLKMGEFLLSMGKITKDQLDRAVYTQQREAEESKNSSVLYDLAEIENSSSKKRLLGDILVDLGYINKDDLESTIEIQKWYNNLFS
ncbi:MAG: hypothetical protein U0457_21820 [Candidatus Sericytochromatia bacterium]